MTAAWDDAAINPIAKLYDTMRVGGTDRPEPRRVPTDAEVAEGIEAQVRRLMAAGFTEDRGFDSGRTLADEKAALDALLDRWNELTR